VLFRSKAFERKWRDCFFWDRYETTQMDSLVLLLDELCEKFKIPKITIGHNVRQDGVENFKGIATRSNYDVDFKDVNPAFDFKLLEKKLKNDESI
jgi:translation initiation factor 2 beta subunit (eIF-2beta)/eIF-5